MRKIRRAKGSMFIFVSVLLLAIVVVGVGFFVLIKTLAGMRELQNATESGNLNVAKSAFKTPAITLEAGLEKNNFSGLLDDNGTINLRNYNRVVGQVLLVALNAQSQGTAESREHARSLISALQIGNGSIGERLHEALSDGFASQTPFDKLAGANFLRLLGQHKLSHKVSEYQIGYLKKGASANVYLDPTILPGSASIPAGTYSTGSADSTGFQYLSGYQPVEVSGIGTIAGVPVLPNQRPHLVSTTDFANNTNAPVSGLTLPPNSFKSAGAAKEHVSQDFLRAISCSIVGALDNKFTASIPHGYIVLNNPSGTLDSTPAPNAANIFNNELFTGVFVANNGAFSTDRALIDQWAAYNSVNPPAGPQPPTNGLFGDPHSIKSLGGNGYPSQCDYTSMDGAGANAGCQSLRNAFEQAYGADYQLPSATNELTAVEQFRAYVWGLFPNGGTINVPSGFSGIRIFNYSQPSPVAAGQPPVFTSAGTIAQILGQVGNGSGSEQSILKILHQRIREIKPEATKAEIDALLASRTFGLGQKLYIYLSGKKLQLTETAPPWIVPNTVADGKPIIVSSSFQTIGTSVNPPGDAGFRNVVFEEMPDPSTFGLGREEAILTPSSGYNNLLATLEFRSRIEETSAAPSNTSQTRLKKDAREAN